MCNVSLTRLLGRNAMDDVGETIAVSMLMSQGQETVEPSGER